MDSNSPTTLSLALLGGFSARVGEAELALPTRKARALLAYLGVSLGRAEPREKLCALFWRDTRREQAQQSLRQTLFSIRRALPESAAALVANSRSVALDPAATWVDVHDLERHAGQRSRHALERAAELYRGPLLEGLSLDEAPFDEWLAAERRRLAEITVAALSHLSNLQSAANALDAALQTRLRLARIEPRAESNHRAILKLYVEQGRRAAALEHYRAVASALPRGTSLEPETAALYEILVGPHAPHVTPEAGAGSLVGREAERATLLQALNEAWSGKGRVLVLGGSAGAGKTRLLDEVDEHAGRSGARVIRGRAFESEQILPFALWVDALRAGGLLADESLLRELTEVQQRELLRLSPRGDAPATDAPTSGPALRLFEAVSALLAAAAARGAVALLLDDLQWADEMSLRLLAYLGRHLAASRVFIACTARREELARAPFLPSLFRELARGGHLLEVDVPPLSREDTAALVRLFAGEEGVERLLGRVWALSEGNPFVALESVRAFAGGAVLGDIDHLPVPERVRELVTAHVGRLSPLARELAEVAAVIGREFDFSLLEIASDRGDVEVASGVEELVHASVMKEPGGEPARGDAFYFTHDRLREVVYGGLLPVKRAVLHGRVARAIEHLHASNLDPVCDQLALHHGRAGDAAAAVACLLRFAENASRAFGLEDALVALSEAAALLQRLPADERPRRAVEIDLRRANCLAYLGRFAEIEPCLRPHQGVMEALQRPDLTAQFYFWMGFNHSVTGNRALASRYIGVSLHAAVAAGDANTRQRAHGLMAYECANSGEFRKGIEHGLQATSAPEVTEPEYLALAFMNLGLNYLGVGQHEDALAAFDRAKRAAEAGGVARVGAFVTGFSGYALVRHGDAESGIAACRKAVELAADPLSTMSVYNSLACALVEGGEPDAALEILPNMIQMCRKVGLKSTEGMALLTASEAHLSKGDSAEALAQIEASLPLCHETGNRRNVGRGLCIKGQAALAEGDLETAAAALSESERVLREADAQYDLGITLVVLGELHRTRSDAARADRCFDEAEALFERLSVKSRVEFVRAARHM